MRKDNELCSYKSNALIQNYAWHLQQYELKIFEFICCCYETKYYNKEENKIIVSLDDFCTECNIDNIQDGGTYYARFKKALKKLSDTSIWVIKENTEELLRIINKVIIEKDNSVVICQMSEDYKNHMMKQINGNAFIQLKIINKMTSKYSINLYNLLRSWDGKSKVVFDIDYLKEKLLCTSATYNNITKFKQVLNKAIDEINLLTDFNVSYSPKKVGKRISAFEFHINKKAIVNNDKNSIVEEQIEYDRLQKDYLKSPYVTTMRDIIVKVYQSKSATINISRQEHPTEEIQKMFKNIKYSNIANILNRINENECCNNGNTINYIENYLKAALYSEALQNEAFAEYQSMFDFSK